MKKLISAICFYWIQRFANKNRKWTDETFGKLTSTAALHHLQKEVGETIKAIEDEPSLIFGRDQTVFEFADMYLLLLNAMHKHNFTFKQMHEAAELKMDANRERKWGKANEKGFVEHIK